ncbi:paxillin [Ceratobasidium sp. AG-Ba]|nr:paxillin [Ceratobasidium sp. AG-Ba]
MALSLPSSGTLRISQILPTIKCSRCGEETDINFADQHVCKPTPPATAPTPPAKAPEPARPLSRSTDRASTVSGISVPSVSSYSSRSSTSTKRAPSVRSTRTLQQSPPSELPDRPLYKSTASFQSFQSRSSVDEGTRRGSPPPRSGPSPAPTLRSDQPTSPILRSGPSPVPRSGPSPSPTARSGPSPSPTARSGPSPVPFARSSPSPTPSAIPTRATPSPAPSIPASRTPEPTAPAAPVAPLVPRKLSRSGSGPLPPQPPPPSHAPPPPDTQIGGEAGMAGVGRRGFAAAAQAALFMAGPHKYGILNSGLSPTSIYGHPGGMFAEPGQVLSPTSPTSGNYLNIRTDVGSGTPPLSHSPVSPSPMSRPHSPADNARSPGAEIARANSRSPSPVDVIDGSGARAAAKGKGVVGGLASLSNLANKIRQNSGDSVSLPSVVAAGKQPMRTASPEPMQAEVVERGRSRAMSNAKSRAGSSDAGSETELAYGSWRSPSPPADRRKASLDAVDEEEKNEENTIAFPRRGSNASDHLPKRTGSQSSGYSSSSSSSQSVRRPKQSAGAQTLSALREEDEDDDRSAYTTPSSAEVDGTFKVTPVSMAIEEPKIVAVTAGALSALGADMNRLGVDTDRLNLPTRSKTSASASSGSSSATRRRRIRTCAKCEKRIEDGRWIKVDDGNTVLCENDWKMLYLPKCRQCGLSIETQAIYASDGQLKGKYHKECFNCYSCHQPFPDGSFYVHQERPYCKYHYHEANNSLCAAPSCREPIEGPCAISHNGTRYHPEHFSCEYEDMDGKCNALLTEYWEVKGERMCERHARSTEMRSPSRAAGGSSELRAKKRQTVFLDLGAGNEVGLC